METQNPCDNVPFVHLCSYPTYEEWKLLKNLRRQINYVRNSSYPTYEEWKPIVSNSALEGADCSYPTYEEWKLYVAYRPSYVVGIVSSYPTYEEWKQSLKINFLKFIQEFLSYL